MTTMMGVTITSRNGRPILRIRLSDGRTAETTYDDDHAAAARLHNRFASEGLGLYDTIRAKLDAREVA